MPGLTRLKGGRVYDPEHGIDGEVRDIYFRDVGTERCFPVGVLLTECRNVVLRGAPSENGCGFPKNALTLLKSEAAEILLFTGIQRWMYALFAQGD